MATYPDVPPTDPPPAWLVDLIDDLWAPDFVQDAIRRALLARALGAVPSGPSDDNGVEAVTADIHITTTEMPNSLSSADEGSLHMVCTSYTLTIGDHQVFHWENCHEVVVESNRPGTTLVRLVLTPPTPPVDAWQPAPPAWVTDVSQGVATADFVNGALVAALLDAVMRAAPEQSGDQADVSSIEAAISFTTQPMGSPTDSTTTQCHEHFLDVWGHHIYHWTVCTEVTSFGPVHLEAEHPKHGH